MKRWPNTRPDSHRNWIRSGYELRSTEIDAPAGSIQTGGMKSRTTARFREMLAALPEEVRRQAREAYMLFRDNPSHPGLRFKKVHPKLPIFSARISLSYRAVAHT
jgi:hypothetical protein